MITAKWTLLSVVALSTTALHASSIVAEWTEGVGVSGQAASNMLIWGQTFQPTDDGRLDTITVFPSLVSFAPAPDALTFKFYEFHGEFEVALVASQTVPLQGVPMIPAFGPISASFLDQDILIAEGQTYAFSISYEHPDNEFIFIQLATPEYAAGSEANFYDDIFAVLRPESDLAFRVSAAPLVVDSDGDGVPDQEDGCAQSDVSSTVVLGGCDTGVANAFVAPGCTLADRLAECNSLVSANVGCVSRIANEAEKSGFITPQEKGRLLKCAAQWLNKRQ